MTNLELLSRQIEICELHLDRIKQALAHIKHLYPFNKETFPLEKYEDLSSLDMFTGRIGKLQDTIGTKVFPLYLKVSGDIAEGISFLDMLNKLEKMAIIPSKQSWIDLRDIRNDLAHEYPDSYETVSQTLNKMIEKYVLLEDIIVRIKNDMREKN